MKLFNDEVDTANDDISKIEINKEYARRFEHNKKREDLQRYEELKKRGHVQESDEESSDDDDDDDEDFSDQIAKDENFFKALLRVRSRDPRLKEKDVKLFESDDDESSKREEESERKEKKDKKDKKSMYLKDVVAKLLIEEGPDFEEHDVKLKTYNEEQEDIKKALLDATEQFENEDDDGDFLRVKGGKGKDDKNKEDFDDGEFSKKLEEYFGEDAEVDENTKFLKEFFKNKLWVDKERKGGDVEIDDEVVDELLKDEEEIERQEGYELEYNFRHEENAEDRVIGYSRKVEGTVRKKESKRKEQRERKEERMRVAEMERKEELKHLKNLKKEEIKERMKKVLEIAGIKEDDCPFTAKDLEEEFDPQEYDKMMKAVFDNKYYDDEDLELNSDTDGIDKPDFDKEDELLGLPTGWDVLESHDGFLAARERNKQKLQSNGANDSGEDEEKGEGFQEEEDGDDEAEAEAEGEAEGEGEEHKSEDEEDDEERKEEETEEGKRKRKRKMSVVQKALQEMWEEFYNLDYEGTIGDLKTRFKYVKTKPNRYGLKPDELLALDEKELNQYVSLKKLAPYTDKEWKVPDSKRYQQKLRIKELLRGKRNGQKVPDNKRSRNAAEQPKEDEQGKKKRSQATNISESRRKAYGLISSKPKKNKHKH